MSAPWTHYAEKQTTPPTSQPYKRLKRNAADITALQGAKKETRRKSPPYKGLNKNAAEITALQGAKKETRRQRPPIAAPIARALAATTRNLCRGLTSEVRIINRCTHTHTYVGLFRRIRSNQENSNNQLYFKMMFSSWAS